jgi:sugar lactone lactonase YvrE
MRSPRRTVAVAVLAGTALAAVTGAGVASAAPVASAPHVRQLPGDFVGPLQFSVDGKRIYVADSFASKLYRLGDTTPIASGPAPSKDPENSGSLDGVDARHGRIAYTTTEGNHKNTYLNLIEHGKSSRVANLGLFERRSNPDHVNHYGVKDPSTVSAACKAELAKAGAKVSYRGEKDSHPYAVATLSDGSWLVADAGGNDILQVSRNGHVRVVAVLPPQPTKITSQIATQLQVPSCAGITYAFEPVPTDVEVHRGQVYVTTLPGGAGGVGSVYRVGWGGKPVRIATGFTQATNLAITDRGQILVVQLGQGVYTPTRHGIKQVWALQYATAVEWANGKLYASTSPTASTVEGGGTPVTTPGHVYVRD